LTAKLWHVASLRAQYEGRELNAQDVRTMLELRDFAVSILAEIRHGLSGRAQEDQQHELDRRR
jgi:hypothetical protein